MRPWPQQAHGVPQDSSNPATTSSDERHRPKKLPCGHVLHFACLRSWLERQQNCPTCRAPVLVPHISQPQNPNAPNGVVRGLFQANPPQRQLPGQPHDAQRNGLPQNILQLGPLRIVLGGRNNAAPPNIRPGEADGGPPATDNGGSGSSVSGPSVTQHPAISGSFTGPATPGWQLQQIERQLLREINNLQLQADQLAVVRALQNELLRLRSIQAHPNAPSAGPGSIVPPRISPVFSQMRQHAPHTPAFSAGQTTQSLGSGHEYLPDGVALPEGWTVLPLQPVSGALPPAGLLPGSTQRRGDIGSSGGPAESLAGTGRVQSFTMHGLQPHSQSHQHHVNHVNTASTPSQPQTSTPLQPQGSDHSRSNPQDSVTMPSSLSGGNRPDVDIGATTSRNEDEAEAAARSEQSGAGKGKDRAATVEDCPD